MAVPEAEIGAPAAFDLARHLCTTELAYCTQRSIRRSQSGSWGGLVRKKTRAPSSPRWPRVGVLRTGQPRRWPEKGRVECRPAYEARIARETREQVYQKPSNQPTAEARA